MKCPPPSLACGASRIAKALEQARPQLVILALGSNDGLRGLPVAQMKANLAAIVGAAQARGARVMIVGNRMPPNYGAQYTESFANAFTELGREYKSTVVPFLLEPIAARRELFQPDNLHPTAEAQPAIMEGIWKALRPLLIRASDPRL